MSTRHKNKIKILLQNKFKPSDEGNKFTVVTWLLRTLAFTATTGPETRFTGSGHGSQRFKFLTSEDGVFFPHCFGFDLPFLISRF